MSSIVVSDVSAGYGTAEVVRKVDLVVGAGECVALMGRNGMGKTTTVKAMLGYVALTSGSVSIGGVQVAGARPYRLNRLGVGYGPQESSIFADLTVRQNLELAALGLRRRSRDEGMARAVDDFPVLGDRLRHRAGSLSGGEQKMLVLSRAILHSPGVLVLDEITEGLQPSVVDRVAGIIDRERRTRGATVLVVEQNLAFVAKVADRAVVMTAGRIDTEVDRLDDGGQREISRAFGL